MARRGRPPKGADLVDSLEASGEARQRLKVILRTVTGELSVPEACERLGVCESRFHELREEALSAALSGLEPKKAGRKPKQVPAGQAEIESLKAQLDELKTELRFSHAREELAVGLPGVFDPRRAEAAKKKFEESQRERERKEAQRARRRR
jgi:hypothetical protein